MSKSNKRNVKQLQHHEKFKKDAINIQDIEPNLSFSFRHMTNNKKYNLDGGVSEHKKNEALLKRMEELSKHDIVYWGGISKYNGGYELIGNQQLYFNPVGYTFEKDEKVYVFRFCGKDCRLICLKKKGSSIMYIIGIDYHFNAYNHGS